MFEIPENPYPEERRLHKVTQYGESDPENNANKNVLGRDKVIAGNLVNKIRQNFFCWTSFVQFNPRLFP